MAVYFDDLPIYHPTGFKGSQALWAFSALCLLLLLSSTWSMAHASGKYQKSLEKYQVPPVTLVDQKGRQARMDEVLSGKRPVILQFVYCTCTTICPVLSAVFSNFQKRFSCSMVARDDIELKGPECRRAADYHLVSVTIDPEHDTPDVLDAYLTRYRARSGWDYFTGTRGDVDKIMRALDAYVPDKMSHYPLTLIKASPSAPWVRIFGFLSTSDLVREYKLAVKGAGL